MSEAPSRIPKPRAGSEPRELGGLDAVERLVFPRVDGALSEAELAALCGLDEATTKRAVESLAARGLVDLAEPPPPLFSETRRAASAAAAEPAGDVDLDAAMRDKIDSLFARLDDLDHYALLGVARDTERKDIKSAYYDAASIYHPDRYFRKRLGAYKPKMEAIFSRATVAHDVLSDRAKRAEYDAYLSERVTSRGIEALLREGLAEIAAAEAAAEEAASSNDFDPPRGQAAPGASSMPPPPGVPGALALRGAPPATPTPPPAATTEPPARSTTPPPRVSVPGAQARRDVLARRLLGRRAPPPKPSTSSPAMLKPPPTSAAEDAVASLRRRYEERVQQARSFQAQKYTEVAEAAAAKGDAIAAANAYRVAVGMSPGDATLAAKLAESQRKADEILSESYSRQASYEEKMGNWAAAAQSWTKVATARSDDPAPHARAAKAILKADGDLHAASRFAQRAVSLQPDSTDHRVTLANVYLAAGLMLNAKRELEAAAQLSPGDDTVRLLLKKVSKA